MQTHEDGPVADDEQLLRKQRRAARKARVAAREEFFASAAPLTPYLAARIDDELFFVSTDDLGVGRRVFVRSGRRDVSTLAKAIARLAELGASIPVEPVFVDVGANIGTTTVRALRRHGFASGVALEPSPDNFRLLRLNLTANGLESVVQALPVAAGDRPGTVTLDVANANHGAHRVAAQVSTDGVTVESVTLDGLVESGIVDPSQAGLLWIDAPGSESGALLGATRLLEAGVPVVVSIRPGGFPERLADLLTACYTDAVELRKQERILPIDAVPGLSGSYRHKGDVLLVRRS